ncbi:MAG: hypothetical protein ABSF22_00515 [Bryobacteraceae bacterium]
MNNDLIGWLATAVFMISYMVKSPANLRRIQAVASCLWLAYGVLIHSLPMIVANFLVAAVALYSSLRSAKSNRPV